MKFIDRVKINLKSGKGGPGCSSFRRETFSPRGGPDGGDGGRGGDVIFRIRPHMHTLFHLHGKKTLSAKNGQPGLGERRSGSAGEPLIVEVPPGTMVKDSEGNLLADLIDGDMLFLKGGKGGLGNWHFKNSVNQTPTYAQPGLPGEDRDIFLELRLIADVGIIGFPNAGKSTLISVLTAAKPKIADYPFTTLQPQLGVVKVDNTTTFTIADIPGLIEGASEGQGLGLQFLQHIERTKVFVHLLDASDFSQRDVISDYEKINYELAQYDARTKRLAGEIPLAQRQQIVVLNKCDAASEDHILDLTKQFHNKGIEVLQISAAAKKNLEKLVAMLCQTLFSSEERDHG